ncbi:MAG: hypothetical protein HOP14_15410 [Acidobacteria bacterium]|nr:hypothetical protein [Acidobacteriota bacterium]
MKYLMAPVALLALCTAASASTAYGTLNNFDVVNDTGQVCHGFEIEIEDVHSTDITYTYDYNHYGTPKIREDNSDPLHPRVFIRYESAKDAAGAFSSYTAVPAGPLSPTNGHQCTNPGVNLGCEHFGVGYRTAPGAVRYNWLVDDGAGTLVHGPAVNIATPSWTYVPPVGAAPARVQAVIEAPEPPEVHAKEFGEAVWVKAIKTTSHNNGRVDLEDLVSDDPDDANERNWRNGEPDEVEVEWEILQEEFSKPGEGNAELAGGEDELPGGDEVVTRRYEFYKYAGPYDDESNEALCDKYPDPNPNQPECDVELLGDYIGAQMAGFNVEAPLGLIEHLQEGNVNEAYVDRAVVVGGNTPYVTTITGGALPLGLELESETGILSGTPLQSGLFTFTVNATDADAVNVVRLYELDIVAGPPQPVVADVDGDSDVDLNDLVLMRARFGQVATGPDDVADLNHDGVINVLDYRTAVTLCTRARCAVQ